MLISLRQLAAGYGGRTILHDVSLDIQRGDFIGIIGPNGGGKTTLVKSIVGLLPPLSGHITYYDARSVEVPSLSVGYLPQKSDVDAQFPITVEQVVQSGLMSRLGWWRRLSAAGRRRVDAVLDDVGLSDFRCSPIGSLSGGQQQRAMLGRAIVAQPELLVLDEPDSYLDLSFEQQLYVLLRRMHQTEGTTILMVSHELGALQPLVTRIFSVEGEVKDIKM